MAKKLCYCFLVGVFLVMAQALYEMAIPGGGWTSLRYFVEAIIFVSAGTYFAIKAFAVEIGATPCD